MERLKYLSNIWRTFEIPLIIFEISLDLNWSENCVMVTTNLAAQTPSFSINDTKLYVPAETLSTQDNTKLLKQWNLVLKKQLTGINNNQTCQQKDRNQYSDGLIDTSFQGIIRLFVLSFENEAQGKSYKRYYL